jgi:polyhydroxyalkanoate synthesis regulator phasin
MPDREKPAVATITAPPPAPGAVTPPAIPPKRSPGHRGADVKDTVAEMAAKAHEISLEAGSKMAAAMKDVVGAAAGLTGFVLESARDLLQYMVRRGQMTQEEADKLMREVEASHSKRKPFTAPAAPPLKAAPRVEATHETPRHTPATSPAVKHVAAPPAKHAVAKKPVAKKPTMKPAAKKHPVKATTKSKPKASGKPAKRR